MRIEAGMHRSESSDGRELFTREPLSREQADVIYRLLDANGRDPDDVAAIELGEGFTRFEPVIEEELTHVEVSE